MNTRLPAKVLSFMVRVPKSEAQGSAGHFVEPLDAERDYLGVRPIRMSCKTASLPSLLFFSPASSSRLMTLRFVTASALKDFSTGILLSAHVSSPHLSIVNRIFSRMNLLGLAHSLLMLHKAEKEQTYKGTEVNTTNMPKRPA